MKNVGQYPDLTQFDGKWPTREVSQWILHDRTTIYALSPYDHSLAIAYQDTLVFLSLEKSKSFKFPELQVDEAPLDSPAENPDISALCWLTDAILAVGLTSGRLVLYDRSGDVVFQQLVHFASVQSVQVAQVPVTSSSASTAQSSQSQEVWILFKDHVILTLSLADILQPKISSSIAFRKWQLHGQSDIRATICCGQTRPTLFQSHPRMGSCSILTVGYEPAVAFFTAAADSRNLHFSKIASAVASKVATVAISAVSSFVKNWGWSASSETSVPAPAENAPSVPNDTIASTSPDYLPVYRSLNDPRRTVNSLALAPGGRYAATTDAFGRVFLIDTSSRTIHRIWKGYRNAQCGWLEAPERWQGQDQGKLPDYSNSPSTSISFGLYLVIYSPVRGLIEVYRMRHGPKVQTLGVGSNARLVTIDASTSSSAQTRCFVLHGDDSSAKKIQLSEVQVTEVELKVVHRYLNANSNQEETFVLFQLLDRIRSSAQERKAGATGLEVDLSSITQLQTIDALKQFVEKVEELADIEYLDATVHLQWIEKTLHSLQQHQKRAELLIWELKWKQRRFQAYVKLTELASTDSLDVSNVLLWEQDTPDNGTTAAKISIAQAKYWFRPLLQSYDLVSQPSFATCDSVSFVKSFNTLSSETLAASGQPAEFDLCDLKQEFQTRKLSPLKTFCQPGAPANDAKQQFLALLFQPLCGDVFSVSNLIAIHVSLGLSSMDMVNLFLEWYFALPPSVLLSMTLTLSSSPLQRWIRQYFQQQVSKDEQNQAQDDASVQLPMISAEARVLYEACVASTELLHVYLLAENCYHAEIEALHEVESQTRGKVSSAGGGFRWRVMQACVKHCLFIMYRLNHQMKLSIQNVESIDPLLYALAYHQLFYRDKKATIIDTIPKTDLSFEEMLEGIRDHPDEVTALRSYSTLLSRYHDQLHQPDALRCLMLHFLTKEWHQDKTNQSVLILMLRHLHAFEDSVLQVAMAVKVWKEAFVEDVLQLVLYFQQHAQSPTASRQIQTESAIKLIDAIIGLLCLIADQLPQSKRRSSREELEVLDESDLDSDVDEDEAFEAVRELLQVQALIGSSSRLSAVWIPSLEACEAAYEHKWPLSKPSSFVNNKVRMSLADIRVENVENHVALLHLLKFMIKEPIPVVDPVSLFPSGQDYLCRENGFTFRISSSSDKPHQAQQLHYLGQLMPYSVSSTLTLTQLLRLPTEAVEHSHLVYLFATAKDVEAEELLAKFTNEALLAANLCRIARQRLHYILKRVARDPNGAALMTSFEADTCRWVSALELRPFEITTATPSTFHVQEIGSVMAVLSLLQRCLLHFDPHSTEFKFTMKMIALTKSILQNVKWADQHLKIP